MFVVLAGADFISSYAYMNTDEFQRQINAGGSQDYGGIAANIYVEPEEDAKWMMIEKVRLQIAKKIHLPNPPSPLVDCDPPNWEFYQFILVYVNWALSHYSPHEFIVHIYNTIAEIGVGLS